MAENYNVGTAYGEIEISASQLSRAIASLDFLSKSMLAVGGAALVGFGYAVKSAADFEQQLSRFKAVGNATEGQIEKIRAKALQLGRDSAYGATEVVQAFAELGYAGASAHEIINGLGDATVYLAAAGEIPLADAARDLIVTMDQFGIKGKGAVKIANELARAANASTANVSDLVTSLRYAGPVASVMGLSFRETAETLAILANNGIRGSTAGTSLRGVLIGLTPTSDKAAAEMKKLGIITLDGANAFFDASGKMKSMSEISQILKDHTAGLTDEQKKLAFSTIFGRRAMASAIILARDGKEAYDKMGASAQYNTTAQKIMKEKLDNLNGSLKILKASLETFAITIGEPFQKPLKKVADLLRGITNWLIHLNPKVLEVAAYVILAFAAFLLFGGILAKIQAMSLRSYRAFVDLAKALQLVAAGATEADIALTPFGLVILVIVVALLIIVGTMLLVLKYWKQVWGFIQHHPAYAAVIAWILSIVAPLILTGIIAAILYKKWKVIWEKIQEVTGQVVEKLKQYWETLKGAATDTVNWVKDAWNNLIAWIKGPFLNFWKNDFLGFFQTLPARLLGYLQTAADTVLHVLMNLPFYLAFVIGLFIGLLIRFAANLVIWAIQGFTQLITIIGQILGQLIPWLMDWGSQAALQILTWITDLAMNMPGWLVQVFLALENFFLDILSKLPGWLLDWLTQFINFGVDAINWMTNFGLDMIQKTGEWAMKIAPKIFEFLAELPGRLLNFGIEMLGQFLAGLGIGVGGIDNFFSELPGRITGALGGLAAAMWGMGWQAITGFFEGLKSIAHHVENWAENFAKSIVKKITDPLGIFSPSKVLKQVGVDAMTGLLQGLEKTAPKVLDSVDYTANKIAMFGGMATSGSGLSGMNNSITINVHGVSDPNQARAAGQAAGEGFSDALARRQLQTTARLV